MHPVNQIIGLPTIVFIAYALLVFQMSEFVEGMAFRLLQCCILDTAVHIWVQIRLETHVGLIADFMYYIVEKGIVKNLLD